MNSVEVKTMKENGVAHKSHLDASNGGELHVRQKAALIEWINSIHPESGLQLKASDEQLRAFLLDGSIFCHILKRLRPNEADTSLMARSECIRRFLTVLGEMGIPQFELSDLEKGPMKPVMESLLSVRTYPMATSGKERRKILTETKVQRSLGTPVMSAALAHHAGLKLHDVFQLKPGQYADLSPSKITEMMKSTSIDNAPTQSLLSVVNEILDESIERKTAEIPLRVACLLRKVVQEIERRISTQADHLRTQNNLFKAREEKYQSRIKVLETLANGTLDETQITNGRSQKVKSEKDRIDEEHVERLMKEKESSNREISALKQELEAVKKIADLSRLQIETDAKVAKQALEETVRELERQLADSRSKVKEADMLLESKNKGAKEIEHQLAALRSKAGELVSSLEAKNEEVKDVMSQLVASRRKVKELEESVKSTNQGSNEVESQFTALRSKVRELEAALDAKNEDSKDVLTQLAASRNKVRELEERLESTNQGSKEVETQFTTVRSKVRQLEAALEAKNGESKEVESQFTTLRSKVRELEAALGAKNGESKEVESQFTTLRSKVRELEATLEAKNGESKEVQSQFTTLRSKVRELETALEAKNEESKDVQTQLAASRNKVRELEECLESTNQGSKEVDSQVTALRSKVRELEAALEAKNEETKDVLTQLASSRSKVKELEESAEFMNQGSKELEGQFAASRSKVRELEAGLEAKNEEANEISRQLADSRSKVKELEEYTESTNHGAKEIERQFAASKSKVRELETCLEEKNGETKELLRQLSVSRSKAKELEESLESTKAGAKELDHQLCTSRSKVKELEISLESKDQAWNKKELTFRRFMNFQFNALQELRLSSSTIKQEVFDTRVIYAEDFSRLGLKFKALSNAAANYHTVLMENRKMFNELQDLKGNIRVYCRIRPFLPGQSSKQTIVESVGEDGELVVTNPSKPGKEGNRLFKFNKVYSPTATQENVYSDIQAFVRSVLDGYNVCIFAYGQTGSGKTYTMTGPDIGTKETWGVNYRALNDLFQISESRSDVIKYEVMVQMIEIYNEKVRDLLSNDGTPKNLGISTASQSSGLAVPDASMHPVKSTSDVLDLMDAGFKNRSVSATALNERSSRSHSILTIHCRGADQKTGSTLRGSLHLVDLAGSERVDRSEVIGDRLKEAQHINKSLSALGDVIFALAQKNAHVPYRNSKLTQVLQSSLGGQAKTLMFVQLNPEIASHSESLSTLKFAERVSGIELGAAKSSKEAGRDVRELMEQVVSLRDTITQREEEIERLQLFKDHKNGTSDRGSLNALSDELKLIGDSKDYEERTSNASSLDAELEDNAEGSTENLDRPSSAIRTTRLSVKSGQIASSGSQRVSSTGSPRISSTGTPRISSTGSPRISSTGSPRVSSGLKKPAAAGGSSTTLQKSTKRSWA